MLNSLMVNEYSFNSITEINDNLQYLDYINSNYEFKEVNINPDMCYKFQGDFFGLLKELNIEPHLYMYTMYLNGYNNPVDFTGENLPTIKLAIKPPIPSN